MIVALLLAQIARSAPFVLETAQSGESACLDGTQPKVYVSLGNQRQKILVVLEAHELPYQSSLSKSLEFYFNKSQSSQGSSRGWQAQFQAQQGILSGDQRKNMHFWNWTKIILKNCDCSLFQGGRAKPVSFRNKLLYFRGEANFRAQIDLLEQQYKLLSNSNLTVVMGGSGMAAGHAALLWAQQVSKNISGKFMVYSDSSLFTEPDLPDSLFSNQLQQFLELVNDETPLPAKDCVDSNRQTIQCFYPQTLLRYVSVPLFLIQSEYDPIQLQVQRNISCTMLNSLKHCTQSELDQISYQRAKILSLLVRACQRFDHNGCWAISCVQSAITTSPIFSSSLFAVPQYSIQTAEESLGQWVKGGLNESSIDVDFVVWPFNTPCANE